MKRFSAREFALLCAPVAVVAGAGFWASPRGILLSTELGKPKLQLHVEKATALQAFGCPNGCVALVTMEVGKNWRGTPYEFSKFGKIWIDTQTPQGTSRWPGYGVWPKNIAPGFGSNWQQAVFFSKVPSSKTTFGIEGMVAPIPNTNATTPVQVSGQWDVEPSEVEPFDFNIPRDPMVQFQSVTVSYAKDFDLRVNIAYTVPQMESGGKHYVDCEISTFAGTSLGNGFRPTRQGQFPLHWLVPPQYYMKTANILPQKLHLSGRLSYDEHWPLIFEIEPFDFTKAKVGQQLNFKSWPAPLPLNVASKN